MRFRCRAEDGGVGTAEPALFCDDRVESRFRVVAGQDSRTAAPPLAADLHTHPGIVLDVANVVRPRAALGDEPERVALQTAANRHLAWLPRVAASRLEERERVRRDPGPQGPACHGVHHVLLEEVGHSLLGAHACLQAHYSLNDGARFTRQLLAQPAARIQNVNLDRVRRRLEEREAQLSPWAATEANSRGRERPEMPSPVRTAFQRDRDRVIHTKAFRRLKHKTQVFIAPQQDHFVTRLTHTIEVAQVARTIARALNLNEDLTEAAALGHDIGHGPFGHAGDEALAECLPEGFRHNYQSVRVLDRLENGGRGLNLSFEVLDAIARSSKAREDILAEGWGVPATLEGQVVKVADAIAYVNHDIADAIRAGILAESDLPGACRQTLGRTHGERIDTLITDAIEASWDATGDGGDDLPPTIRFSPGVGAAANELREFLFRNVYLAGETRAEAERGKRLVLFLFEHLVRHPEAIASEYCLDEDPPERRAADFVSGMTDRYAIRMAQDLGCVDAIGWHS